VSGDVAEATENVAYVIVDKLDGKTEYPILIRPGSREELQTHLDAASIKGVALDGSAEERPGFKDYTDLADILEFLDDY
jgi:hypothetical protein